MAVRLVAFTFFSLAKLVVAKEEGFIVGGDFVGNIRKFPHVAFLELSSKDGNTYICGSSVLTQYILITAAHCFDDITGTTAYVGSLNREKGRPYTVESFEQHEKWNPQTITHDVCLAKLAKALTLGRAIKRLILMRNPPKAKKADLAGWGAVEETDYTDSILLKHTEQNLWTHNECKRVLKNSPKGTICGGRKTSSDDFASKGDSGSGLIIQNKILVGLVSYKDVGVSRSLVIYTDTAYYYDWITRKARRLSCSL